MTYAMVSALAVAENLDLTSFSDVARRAPALPKATLSTSGTVLRTKASYGDRAIGTREAIDTEALTSNTNARLGAIIQAS